jgi:hypothetical protein
MKRKRATIAELQDHWWRENSALKTKMATPIQSFYQKEFLEQARAVEWTRYLPLEIIK